MPMSSLSMGAVAHMLDLTSRAVTGQVDALEKLTDHMKEQIENAEMS